MDEIGFFDAAVADDEVEVDSEDDCDCSDKDSDSDNSDYQDNLDSYCCCDSILDRLDIGNETRKQKKKMEKPVGRNLSFGLVASNSDDSAVADNLCYDRACQLELKGQSSNSGVEDESELAGLGNSYFQLLQVQFDCNYCEISLDVHHCCRLQHCYLLALNDYQNWNWNWDQNCHNHSFGSDHDSDFAADWSAVAVAAFLT